jgi:hypothetical protein
LKFRFADRSQDFDCGVLLLPGILQISAKPGDLLVLTSNGSRSAFRLLPGTPRFQYGRDGASRLDAVAAEELR